ncbi:hypothetical protein ZWY2020_023252 [Hordeum vulgare]|nr:hypothetical protein ZWY2020_023252 [Hordeum vulgare]
MAAEPCVPSGFGTRPWLVQGTRGERQTFVDSSDGSLHSTIVPEMQGKTCLGCIHNGDWLLMLDESTAECFFLRLTSSSDDPAKKIPLPPLHEQWGDIVRCATLGTSPAHPDCVVVVAVQVEDPAVEGFLLHCRPSNSSQGWLRLESPVSLTSFMIGVRGKIYSFGESETLVVIGDEGDGTVRARLMGSLSGEKEVHDMTVTYYVLESCGDLFEVVTQFFGDFRNDGTLTSVTVYRLDLESMTWSRVDSIGHDRAFLVSGHYGFSAPVRPVEGGLVQQGNCVYIVWSSCDCERLYKFCLDDNTISFRQILPRPTKPWCRAFWAVPPQSFLSTAVEEAKLLLTNGLVPKGSIMKLEDEDEQATSCNNTRPWHDLPLELLELIVSRLSLVDRLRFPTVCKSWSLVTNPVEQANAWPWLLHCSGRDGACKLFDPLRGQEYNMHVETFDINQNEHDEHIFRFSKDGWVAMSTNADIQDMFIINPFTEDVMEMVMLDWKYRYMGLSWSSADPADPECVFFAIVGRDDGKAISVFTWRQGEEEWLERHIEYYEEEPFPVAYNNPVLFHGKFYCLGRKGNLGTFDPVSNTWTILEKPKPIHVTMDLDGDHHLGREFCYLVELGGELVSVFIRNADEPPRVFKLKEEMTWMEVQEIGGAALFLDFRVSYAVESPEAGHGNRIYVPGYSEDGKYAAFYDMETKAYRPSFYGLKSPLQCVWVVPDLVPCIKKKSSLGHSRECVPNGYYI